MNAGMLAVARAVLSQPQILLARPAVNWFFCRYMRKFTVKKVGGKLILHSHLPPLNSKAYHKFVNEHLLAKSTKPSHAQIGVTNNCPQDCAYCYNKGRGGTVMDTPTIIGAIRDLKSLGVFWIGLTGGEPLLKKDIAAIVEAIGEECSSKLFTTGSCLTRQVALDLKQAGLQYVTVSLDHWEEIVHDRIRRCQGAFQTALRAIDLFRSLGSVHVSVSAVLSREMLTSDQVEEFLQFLSGLGIHEAWLSETKPSVPGLWGGAEVVTAEERAMLIATQDRWNKQGGMTVNYLGHFEDARYFGCTAGHKMIYVDAFGEVSPCVFVPMTFGNVRRTPLREIVGEMRSHFPSESSCFINKHYGDIAAHAGESLPLDREESLRVLKQIRFGPLAEFFRLQYRT